jgi:two-component system, OmpR family, sensor histidine kinase KdpD
VDELAHTNAPGGRHAKRWQDVSELLDAGISVFTTVNVQHLESLNDVVAKITGVVVRETVPDSVFEDADEVELVDLSAEDLRQRLREGKVYMPEAAADAIQGFFREGNLIALRELALRRTADRVDVQMQRYRRDHGIPVTWPVAERVLVCIGPSPNAGRLIRAGRRLATQLEAPWVVAWVETPTMRLSDEARARVLENLRLAEQLGAETVTLSGPTMSEELLAYAHSRNVSKIVIGKPQRTFWRRVLFGSIVDALVRGAGDVDIYVISRDAEPTPPRPRARLRLAPPPSEWPGYALTLAVVVACTAAAWAMFPKFELSNIIMVYLLGVIAVASRAGRAASVLASVLSVAAFDFFFVPPYYTFAVSDSQYLVTFAVMLVVALVVSGLTLRTRGQAEAARQRERRTSALYAMSRELAGTRGIEPLLDVALRHAIEVFGGRMAILLPGPDGRLVIRASMLAPFTMDPNDFAVSQWAFEHGQVAGAGTDNLPGAQMLCVPLRASRGVVGILAMRLAQGAMQGPDQAHLLETFANQIAVAIERALLAEEAEAAQLKVETERLRNTLLSTVSHDLRTPLASIAGSATSLLDQDSALSPAARRDLLQTIYEEAERLNRLVQNLLAMTRLESGAVDVRREWHPIEEVVGAALTRLASRLADRAVKTHVPADLPLGALDDVLIEQVLINLLENALQYTPPTSPIEIGAWVDPGAVVLEVADRGPGLPRGDESRVFEKFYRTPGLTARGAGLGLSICQAIVEAHGGRIVAENRPGGGVAFRVTLPLVGAPPVTPPDA